MKGQSNLLVIIVFFVAMIGGVFAMVNVINSGFDMKYQIEEPVIANETVDSNWLSQARQSEFMTTTSEGYLTPERNEAGIWVWQGFSPPPTGGLPTDLQTVADMTDGSGTVKVRTFSQEPDGSLQEYQIDFESEEENSENIQYVNGGIEVS